MKKTSLMFVLALIGATSVNAQMGQGQGNFQKPDASEMFSKMDSDGNGSLSFTEFTQREKERFSEADTNGDGSLSQSEFKTSMENMGGKGHGGMPPRRNN